MLNNILGTAVARSAVTVSATSAQAVSLEDDAGPDEFLCPPHDEALGDETSAPLLYGWVAPENRATYYYGTEAAPISAVVARLIAQMR